MRTVQDLNTELRRITTYGIPVIPGTVTTIALVDMNIDLTLIVSDDDVGLVIHNDSDSERQPVTLPTKIGVSINVRLERTRDFELAVTSIKLPTNECPGAIFHLPGMKENKFSIVEMTISELTD